jgi:hypothetical protein
MISLNVIYLTFYDVLPFSSQQRPFWARIILTLDSAVEFPFFFAFHPTVLAHDAFQDPY